MADLETLKANIRQIAGTPRPLPDNRRRFPCIHCEQLVCVRTYMCIECRAWLSKEVHDHYRALGYPDERADHIKRHAEGR